MTINRAASRYFLVAMNENLNHLPLQRDRRVDVTVAVDIGNDSGAVTNTFTVTKDAATGIPQKIDIYGQAIASTGNRAIFKMYRSGLRWILKLIKAPD